MEVACAITQAISYIPYGEVFVEQQAGGWSSPYLFNAKELDSETGLYYYGARYLDPSDAMWLSVDSLWEKYVGMSPYQYCMGNPVKLVDVDGQAFSQSNQSMHELNRVTSDTDYQLFLSSVDNIIEHGGEIGEMLKYLKENPNFNVAVYVNYNNENYFDEKTGILAWDPSSVLYTDKGYELPSIVTLAHESRHAYDFTIDWSVDIDDPNKYFTELSNTPSLLKNGPSFREDNAVQSETECAKMFNLIPESESSTRSMYLFWPKDENGNYLPPKVSNDVYKVVDE